jgi:predicted nucleotidyltransferase
MASSELVQKAGERLAAAAGDSAKVILFGSHARGEARADSDVDFLVIEPRVTDRHKEWRRLRRSRRAKVPGTMVRRATRDGRVISER